MDNMVILVTAASEEDAIRIGRAVVEEGLVACANIIPRIRSLYKWDGEVCDDGETLMIMKTRSEQWKAIEKRVGQLHNYDVPEVIALPIVEGSKAYLDWIRECT
jgi:periplasmic divalent cation tolerance protein